MSQQRPALPASETHMGVNLFAALLGCTSLLLMQRYTPEWDMFFRSLVVIFTVVTPILLADIFWRKPHNHPSAALSAWRAPSLKRVAIKTLGMYGVFGIFAFLYHVLPVYESNFYTPFWDLAELALPWMILSTPFYLRYLDRIMDVPEDGYYHLGRVMLMQRSNIDTHAITRLLRNWLVKAFFLPLMFIYLMENVTFISSQNWSNVQGFAQWYAIFNNAIFLVDLLFACTGYIITLRIVNAHIRSSEPTFFGWFIAVMCYTPFWNGLFYREYFAYDDNGGFTVWLANQPLLLAIIGTSILILLAIYSWATVAMGYRFSNLTYRGLITNGPYRFTKHPAYVTKNISWWLVSMPFLTKGENWEIVQNCTLLFGINIIYYLRARTEEAHLSNYPEYVTYAEAMNERSIFAPLARRLPFLRYTKPVSPPAI